jgi:hypothetical protein
MKTGAPMSSTPMRSQAHDPARKLGRWTGDLLDVGEKLEKRRTPLVAGLA